jgi:hypothetical protein
VDPPRVDLSVGETRELNGELRDLTDGKFILTPHSGTYCRTGYYEEPMLEVYREAVAGGAEVAVHLHEETRHVGTRYAERDHMQAMFADCQQRLASAGIKAVAYRGGHYAYHPFMNSLLPENGIFIDLSACPGLSKPDREAIWDKVGMDAGYLPENPREDPAGQPRSPVLEIPMGSDGEGSAYGNILHIEQSPLENLTRIWDVITSRADKAGQPQIVHCLFHTGSMGDPDWRDRMRRFFEMVPTRGGSFVTASEAKRLHDAMPGRATP